MTVDEFLIRETDDLVHPDKIFYPLKIPIAHPQLRHFINAQEPDLIYYASGHDVYCLNTETKARTHIHHVPFDCRCTAAGYGWICVAGGDKGNFTIIQLDGGNAESGSDVDSLLPIGLNERPLGRPTPSIGPPKVKMENIGSDIINSITIHKLHGDEDDLSDEVLAIITSNDRTVRIYSLTLGHEVALLELPFPMNHATISPDGDLLLAVGDYNQAYFYERMEPEVQDPKKHTPVSKASNWEVMNIVQLHCPKDIVAVGYFTTAWSPSGGLCAVGSESGYVSLFDTELIRTADWGEDAIVEVIHATRPESRPGPGAIRSMLFSPHPWDLLIWAEDRGRVVIADIRAGLRVRQVIKLDPDESGVHKVEIQDFSAASSDRLGDFSRLHHRRDSSTSAIHGQLRALTHQVETLRQYRLALDADVDLAAVSMSNEYLDLLTERRRLQRLAAAVEEDPNGLSAEERQILNALRTSEGQTTERDFGYSPFLTHSRSASQLPSDGSTLIRQADHRVNALSDHPRLRVERANSRSSNDNLRSGEADSSRSVYEPRRQASIVLSIDHGSNDPNSDATTRPNGYGPYAQIPQRTSTNWNDAMRVIESEWTRNPPPLSNLRFHPRPHTPPHALPSDIHPHIANESSRPSTSDSMNSLFPPADDRADNSAPLRRRTPALRAIEAHHQTISQLRQQNASSSSGAVPSAASPYDLPNALPSAAAAVRPASSSSTASPSPPATGGGIRRSTTLRRHPSNPRSRSRSRTSDRVYDYDARLRYMSRYADPQTLNFLQRQVARYDSPDCGERSAGLAMSTDGGKLWCASERGILELTVDLWARRGFPAQKFA